MSAFVGESGRWPTAGAGDGLAGDRPLAAGLAGNGGNCPAAGAGRRPDWPTAGLAGGGGWPVAGSRPLSCQTLVLMFD